MQLFKRCSNHFYFQLKREKGVKRENMSVTCKDLIEYVMEQQKVKQLWSISFLERDVTFLSTKHVCSLFISPQEDFLAGGAKDKENPFPLPHPCKIFWCDFSANFVVFKIFQLVGDISISYFTNRSGRLKELLAELKVLGICVWQNLKSGLNSI